jgi:hypothetical protein
MIFDFDISFPIFPIDFGIYTSVWQYPILHLDYNSLSGSAFVRFLRKSLLWIRTG